MEETQVQVAPMANLAEINASEIDMQISTAHKFPRNENKALKKSMELATINAKVAQSCIYLRPVGKDKKTGKQKFASGNSIRLAEIMKTQWGNLRIAKRVIGTRDGMVGVEWAVHDLETNVMDRGEVWKSYFGIDRMIPLVQSACMKFAERDAVFAIVPKSYADIVVDKCKSVIVGDDEKRLKLMDKLLDYFDSIGYGQDEVMMLVDPKEYPEGSDGEVVFLLGIANVIRDGLVDAKDVFGMKQTKPTVSKTTPK